MNRRSAAKSAENDGFFKEVLKVIGYGAAFAAIPLFASMENLQPPWPTAIAYVSAAVILVATLIAWEFGSSLTKNQRRIMLMIAIVLTLMGLFSYLYLYSNFVIVLDEADRVIIGYECNLPTSKVYPTICPNLGKMELERASYDPTALFTKDSLTNVRMLLVASWLVFVAGLMAAVGWAVAGRTTPLVDPTAK